MHAQDEVLTPAAVNTTQHAAWITKMVLYNNHANWVQKILEKKGKISYLKQLVKSRFSSKSNEGFLSSKDETTSFVLLKPKLVCQSHRIKCQTSSRELCLLRFTQFGLPIINFERLCDRHIVDTQSTLGKDKKWVGGREIEGGHQKSL